MTGERVKLIRAKQYVKSISLLEWFLLAVFAVQFIVIVFFNLKLHESHVGYDSSWSYLKAVMIWKEKALFSDAWLDTTSLSLDSSTLLAALIYGITGKLFLSYGLSNLIILSCAVLLLYKIAGLMGLDRKIRLLCANLVICPYLVNGFHIGLDLGYFNSFIAGASFYGVRVVVFLLITYNFLLLQSGRASKVGILASMALCVLCGVSSGILIIVLILIPCFAYLIERCLIKNSFAVLKNKEAIYTYCCLICIYGGKVFAEKVLHIVALDTSRSWTTIEKIWTNFGAVIQGLMKLMGILPVTDTSVWILTKEGIFRLFPLAIFFVAMIAVVFCTRYILKNLKECNENVFFCVNIIVCQFLVFGLFNAQYGAPIFEERYLICALIDIILLVGFFVSRLPRKYIVTYTIWMLLIGGICGTNIVSDHKYITTTNDSWELSNITEIVRENDAALVYLWGDTLETLGRSLRVYDLDHIYKCIPTAGGRYSHWGDYLYYEQNEEYEGPTILIVPNDTEVNIPDYIMSHYSRIGELTWVNIYRSNTNPMDFTAGITNEVSMDYPYTTGVFTQNGAFEGSDFVSDGTGGLVMYGPHAYTREGVYDFTVFYEVVEPGNQDAIFDVALDWGAVQLGETRLAADKGEVTLENIYLENGHTFEYRISCEEGTIIKIKKIEIREK